MKKSIVCGVDDSADSEAALAVAARLADRFGARLVLANVVDYVHSPYATVDASGPARSQERRSPTNSCMRTWIESGRGNHCVRCFIVVAGGLASGEACSAGVDCLSRNFGLDASVAQVGGVV